MMRYMKTAGYAAALLALLLLTGCSGITEAPATARLPQTAAESGEEEPMALESPFIRGMDASSVIAEEDSGVVYRGFDGEERDVFETLAEAGITHIRVRVWNDPYDAEGHGYGGGNCDIEKAAAIGRRAARCGLGLIVDFHYSDFWADPGKQRAPKAWEGLTAFEKADAAYAFTRESLQTLTDAGAAVELVQLGNETNGALCGETSWPDICTILRAGIQAVRDVCPDALTAVHFTNPETEGRYADYAEKLARYGVEYDVFASSYYPFWHGSLENLAQVLTDVAEKWHRKVMVMETSYPYTEQDSDFWPNTVSGPAGPDAKWPFTEEGQALAVRAVTDTAAGIPGCIGVVYWEGTWIAAGGASRAENEALWESCGSGWAASYAAGYDPEDAGKWYGGCAVDNQALFGPDGTPLAALRAFGGN